MLGAPLAARSRVPAAYDAAVDSPLSPLNLPGPNRCPEIARPFAHLPSLGNETNPASDGSQRIAL